MQKYLECKPFIGYEKKYEVWHKEAEMALEMGAAAPIYRARQLADSLAPQLGMLPTDKNLIDFATVLVLRSDLIQWYAVHMDKKSFVDFEKTHTGFLHWREGGQCIDLSFLPLYILPYEYKSVDIEATWLQARRMGLEVEGYVDGIYTEQLLIHK